MVHRIARLVEEGRFPAWQILATSFNRDATRQIETALRGWPSCADVRVKTLHAVGYAAIRLACERGYLPQPVVFSRTAVTAAVTAASRSPLSSYVLPICTSIPARRSAVVDFVRAF